MVYVRTQANSSGFLEFGSFSQICKEKKRKEKHTHTMLPAVDGVLVIIAFKLVALFSVLSTIKQVCRS